MRVAVIGGNVVGVASAVYIERALAANRAEQDGNEEDEVVIFEQQDRLGGLQFQTAVVNEKRVIVGTAAELDLSFLPAFRQLCNDCFVQLPGRKKGEWTVFNWDSDEYRIGATRSKFWEGLEGSLMLGMILQGVLLGSLAFFVREWGNVGIRTFLRLDDENEQYLDLVRVLWIVAVIMLGGGIIPIKYICKMYGMVYFLTIARVTGQMTYGGYSLSMLEMLRRQIVEHVETVLKHDAASSCISIQHLFSACGMRKYVEQSGAELLAKVQMGQEVIHELIEPQLQILKGRSKVKVADCNALSMLMCLARCKWGNKAWRIGEWGVGVCERLCEKVKVEYGMKIVEVRTVEKGRYEVWGEEGSRGVFDGVVIACGLDEGFETDVVEDLKEVMGKKEGEEDTVNVARNLAVVKGVLKESYLKKGKGGVADCVSVLDSVCVCEVAKFEGGWRIVGGEGWKESLFESIEEVKVVRRKVQQGDGGELIWGERVIYLGGIGSLGGGVEVDVLAGRNVGSLFRKGVAEWK